ncbi:MAG TPA: Hpt domain-containing protein [Thermoanaerobaculia bacterium]|nr:Hpt domain-containing protein [Thermoanaerobaculia bacterium]
MGRGDYDLRHTECIVAHRMATDPELDQLKREFLVEAEEKLDEIRSLLAGEPSDRSIERMIYLTHQLKGAGGSYGFSRISTEAAELEDVFEGWLHGTRKNDRLAHHLENLGQEIRARMQQFASTAVQ